MTIPSKEHMLQHFEILDSDALLVFAIGCFSCGYYWSWYHISIGVPSVSIGGHCMNVFFGISPAVLKQGELAQQTFCMWVYAAFRAWDFGESFTTVSMGYWPLIWLVSHSEESCSLLLRDLHAQDLFHFFLPQNVYFAQCLYKPIHITKICVIAPCWGIWCWHGFCTAWYVSAGWAEASFNVVFSSFQPCNVWVARAAWKRD